MSEMKRALRSRLIAVRARLTPEDRAAKAHAIVERATQVPRLHTARTVALYAPLGGEVDPTELGVRLRARGAGVVYPRVVAGNRCLAFARAEPHALVAGPLGALEPPPGAPDVGLDEIDCVVLPGVAFSGEGLRLGRGGGYYDATLARMPAAARIGLAFDAQLVPTLPREPHDEPLDAIVTELRTLLFDRDAATPGGAA